jgi:hypothetical protein
MAMKVINENHTDSEVRKGKRSGAFCATVTPELTPWVLLNYQCHSDDVATMAHELGHAIHSLLASGHSIFTQNACLPLAETASTFGEMMLVDRLLEDERDENVRRDLLFRQVDDSYATIMRQAFFALFEKQWITFQPPILRTCKPSSATVWILLKNLSGNGSPSRISTMCRFTCMPMPLDSCWCSRFISSLRKKAMFLNHATSGCWLLAGQTRLPRSFQMLAWISTRLLSGKGALT